MSSKDLIRLRRFTYSAFIVLWAIAIYLITTGNFDFFSGLDWIVYFTTALAWATLGSLALFLHRINEVEEARRTRRAQRYALNWTDSDGIFAPRETV